MVKVGLVFILLNIILTKKQSVLSMSIQAGEITVVYIQSLNEYVAMKILANRHKIKQHLSVRKKVIDTNVMFDQLEVEIRHKMGSKQYEQIVVQLQSAQLKAKRQKKQQLQTWHLQEFEQMIFGGCEVCLLRTHYFSDCKKEIEQNLFLKDNFQVKRVEQENPEHESINRNWFMIKRVKSYEKQVDQYIKPKNFQLIKIKKSVIFNLTQFHHNGRKYLQKCQGTQLQAIEDIFRGTESAKYSIYLEFGYRLNIYIRFHFKEKNSIVEFVERMLRLSLQQCLYWDLQTHRATQLYWSDFNTPQFVQSFNRRFDGDTQNLEKVQITKTQTNVVSSCQSQDFLAIQAEELNLICNNLLEMDIIAFQNYWPRLSSNFDELLYTWSVRSFTIEDSFKRFLKIISERRKRYTMPIPNSENKKHEADNIKKPQIFVLYDYLCPNIDYYLREFQNRLHYSDYRIQKGHEPKIHGLDILLWSYFQEVQSINKGNGCLLIKTKGLEGKPLKEFLPEMLALQSNSAGWEDVFNTVTINTKKIIKSHESALRMTKTTQSLLENIQYEPFPITECLGCSQFFYHNTNIPRGSHNSALKLIPLASKIKDYESAIKEQICKMLNNNGGVILFNCAKQYGSIFPHGAIITEKDKQGYEHQIMNLLNTIHPRPEIKKNVIITFVPVVHSPLSSKCKDRKLLSYTGVDQQLKTHQLRYSLVYIEGLFVTRIRVVPTDTRNVYMWLSEDSIYHLSGFYSKTTKRQFKIADLSKAIKLKMNKYNKNRKMSFRPLNFGNPFNHECVSPDQGKLKSEKEEQVNVVPPNIPLEDVYSHVTMLIARSRYLQTIREKLVQKGVHCHLEVKFQKFKLKSASHTAVLYHNVKFQEILNILRYNISEFTFQGKPVLAIYVTEYIKLQESNEIQRIKDEELQNTARFLNTEFPNDRLRLFEYRKDKIFKQLEYFIKVGSKISTLFIYYVLNHHKIRSIFKNPQGLDRMALADKDIAFREVNFLRLGQSKQHSLNETLAHRKMSTEEV